MARIIAAPNSLAFLDMIAHSEGTSTIPNSDDGYKVLVGSMPGHALLFSDYSAPPNVFNSKLNSTAAGRYQILHKYAVAYIAQLKLPDFGPESQDWIAVQMIRECGAFPDIFAGRIPQAIALCASRWASLPGNNYQQHQNSIESLIAAYTTAGGVNHA